MTNSHLEPDPAEGRLNVNNCSPLAFRTTTEGDPRMYVYHSTTGGYSFDEMRAQIAYALLNAKPINRGQWQTLDVSQSAAHDTRELRNVALFLDVPETLWELWENIPADQPWADNHFDERVGRVPLNPAPSYKIWPYHHGDKDRHVDGVFSHTYPERYWPKHAGDMLPTYNGRTVPHIGLRFEYGDLDGVVGQLVGNPLTRQAVLPMWFPEDTGALDRRVPCSLTYHFMADGDDVLSVWYSMRACDFYRHFTNDMYLTARLLQWVCAEVARRGGAHFKPGQLNATVSSLHLFEGDVEKVKGK